MTKMTIGKRRLLILLCVAGVAGLALYRIGACREDKNKDDGTMSANLPAFQMPGKTYTGPLPELTEPQSRSVRFVLFVNEEPPFFQTEQMGSLVYARRCRQRNERVTAMLSLETIGYYSDKKGSQQYPAPFNMFYPDTGNFIGFIGNIESKSLIKQATAGFRRHAKFPSQGGAIPDAVAGVGWSDHWAFWQAGYPALMVTDTAPFRYPYYHDPRDKPGRLDYERMARVVEGLENVVADLATPELDEDNGKVKKTAQPKR